jgi:hypothetical protein
MSNQRQWRVWFVLHLAEDTAQCAPLGVSRRYECEVSSGADEVMRALTELHRQWTADGCQMIAVTKLSLSLETHPTVVRCNLECWCDGRQLSPDECEALMSSTTTEQVLASWHPGRQLVVSPQETMADPKRLRDRHGADEN